MHFKADLYKSIQTGFIDQSVISNNEYLPQLLINDKSAGKKVLTTLKRELEKCDEFWFSVAFVTHSGVATLINTLSELEEKGIRGKILVSQYLNFSQPEALKSLLKFKNITLKIAIAGNFHSKGYLFKNNKLNNLIIGSSNLTANALCSNKEWNLKISASSESYIIFNALKEFASEFDNATPVDLEFIARYEPIYKKQRESVKLTRTYLEETLEKQIFPNGMQIEALAKIQQLRAQGKTKALLISATGTGKTYLSAFDALKFNPDKFLFIVHRANIAEAAMKTFKSVFGKSKSMGIYSGNRREKEESFLFSTIQTISRTEHLDLFESTHFDYIVIDETHRAGAESYQKILNHFKPKFLLGMTATPERTDGLDIFKLFDHTIAYEIRLHKAMEEDMLSPFHYYGVTDISLNGKILDDKSDFTALTSSERIERIIEKTKLYGCDDGEVRGLVFCSRVEECAELSAEFNKRGFKTLSLTGANSDIERSNAISRLELDAAVEKLDYLFTVDIFNEGVDIPRVNQVILLRATQSAIIFVQQLGRGLRKSENKEYLTVIDFIGNYSSNFLVPMALYGDTSYNKDNLRKLMASGSDILPGASTINFDKISMEKIYAAIDSANLQLKKDLIRDYQLLKFRLGRIPMMVDYILHGCRDPFHYVNYSKSYFNFVASQESVYAESMSLEHCQLLDLISFEIANSKRIEEVIIMQELLVQKQLNIDRLKQLLTDDYALPFSEKTLTSSINNINFIFVRKRKNVIIKIGNHLKLHDEFLALINNQTFVLFLKDVLDYSKRFWDEKFNKGTTIGGLILYQKYSRKDVCRILNWDFNEESTVFGYKIKHNTCPIFVNYHKEEKIASSTKFEDKFLNNKEFQWFTKPRRNFSSKDVVQLRDPKAGLRLPLFIKKSNGEGSDFYYMGDVMPIDESFLETTIKDDKGKLVSVVKVILSMNIPVIDSIYNYITNEDVSTTKSIPLIYPQNDQISYDIAADSPN